MIRTAVKQDVEPIMEIIRATIEEMKSYGNTQWNDRYPLACDFEKDVENGDLYVDVAEDGSLAGFVCINSVEPQEYSPMPWKYQGPVLVAHRMAVNPLYRRKGIGTKLLAFAEQTARDAGAVAVRTDTNSVNAKMNALFCKLGYELVGQISLFENPHLFNCYEKRV